FYSHILHAIPDGHIDHAQLLLPFPRNDADIASSPAPISSRRASKTSCIVLPPLFDPHQQNQPGSANPFTRLSIHRSTFRINSSRFVSCSISCRASGYSFSSTSAWREFTNASARRPWPRQPPSGSLSPPVTRTGILDGMRRNVRNAITSNMPPSRSYHRRLESGKPHSGSAIYRSTSTSSRDNQSKGVVAGAKRLFRLPIPRRLRSGLFARPPERRTTSRASIRPSLSCDRRVSVDAERTRPFVCPCSRARTLCAINEPMLWPNRTVL